MNLCGNFKHMSFSYKYFWKALGVSLAKVRQEMPEVNKCPKINSVPYEKHIRV